MTRLPVPDDYDSGHVSVSGPKDYHYENGADVNTDAVDHARDLSVREDEDGRYVGCSDRYADEVAEYLGVDAPTTDEDGGDADECQEVKADGEVCGRELPCPYHSDDEEATE